MNCPGGAVQCGECDVSASNCTRLVGFGSRHLLVAHCRGGCGRAGSGVGAWDIDDARGSFPSLLQRNVRRRRAAAVCVMRLLRKTRDFETVWVWGGGIDVGRYVRPSVQIERKRVKHETYLHRRRLFDLLGR